MRGQRRQQSGSDNIMQITNPTQLQMNVLQPPAMQSNQQSQPQMSARMPSREQMAKMDPQQRLFLMQKLEQMDALRKAQNLDQAARIQHRRRSAGVTISGNSTDPKESGDKDDGVVGSSPHALFPSESIRVELNACWAPHARTWRGNLDPDDQTYGPPLSPATSQKHMQELRQIDASYKAQNLDDAARIQLRPGSAVVTISGNSTDPEESSDEDDGVVGNSPRVSFGWPLDIDISRAPRPLTPGAFRLLSILPRSFGLSDSHCSQNKKVCDCEKLHCGSLPCYRLHCELSEHISFSKAPPYNTVSYCWGDQNTRTTIHIMDFELEVVITVNGRDVLQNLQHSTEPRVVWIDAVCINQSDPVEKAIQIGIMGHLYFRAESCIAFVGISDATANHVFSRFSALKPGLDSKSTKRRLVTQFMLRPWFSRLWVVQEALLSEKIILQCQRQTMDFGEFSNIHDDVFRYTEPAAALPSKPDCTIIELRRWYVQQEQPGTRETKLERLKQSTYPFNPHDLPSVGSLDYETLFDVMYATQKYGCSDQRDRLFGILSLFDGPAPKPLEADYTVGVRNIRDRVFAFLWQKNFPTVSGLSSEAVRSYVNSFFS